MTVRILKGDCRDVLRELPDESVQCCVTSPPYWGLRDYGVSGQLGMEASLGEHVDTMVGVFQEVRRVLRSNGTLWLNYGDSYATSPNGRSAADVKALGNDDRTFRDKPFSTIGPIYVDRESGSRVGQSGNKGNPGADNKGLIISGGSLKPKDLCGIPWRVALALQADGWWLRQDIIWSKPNPMPESVRDRCTKAHEYIFMLTKSGHYSYDADAISEDAIYSGLANQDESGFKSPRSFNGKHKKGYRTSDKQRGHSRRHAGFNDRWDAMDRVGQCSGKRNKRSVWNVATKPFADAHFATFPPELIEPCILAGCPKGGMVLDPFGGAGTTGMVADRLGRDAILIELNPEYADMAERRIKGDAGMFASVAAK